MSVAIARDPLDPCPRLPENVSIVFQTLKSKLKERRTYTDRFLQRCTSWATKRKCEGLLLENSGGNDIRTLI